MTHFDLVAAKFNATHDFTFQESVQFLSYIGSRSHGTYISSTGGGIDDIDLFAVVIPPPKYLIGLHSFDNWQQQWDDMDVVVYSLHKYASLLCNSNPNVLSSLWSRPEDVLLQFTAFGRLVTNRSAFATKAAYKSFAGYANGQMQRMTALTKEIQDEIDTLQVDLENAGWSLQDVMDRRPLDMPKGITPDEANIKADRLRLLRARYHSAYQGAKRRELVQTHGWDLKMGAHLIRLLSMCIEFMNTGEMHPCRTGIDADKLKDIKRGEWSLDRVKAHAEDLFAQARVARDNSSLPEATDFELAQQPVGGYYFTGAAFSGV